MFDSSQSIMLMGAAENVDVSVHLANASVFNSSELQILPQENSVTIILLFKQEKVNIFSFI